MTVVEAKLMLLIALWLHSSRCKVAVKVLLEGVAALSLRELVTVKVYDSDGSFVLS